MTYAGTLATGLVLFAPTYRDRSEPPPEPPVLMLFVFCAFVTLPWFVLTALLKTVEEPREGDGVNEWHRALDQAVGVLFVMPILVGAALVIPVGTALADGVVKPLLGLAVVGSLFTALVPFRSAIHEATGHRHRRQYGAKVSQ
ncbi:MAG: hypothetical protein L0H31_13855 [Nocardioidaceae bacterium]|nr:hypothetical protein [Nocardioidaceae bacterium]